ncbi:hypothetical protein [Streptomyces brasiliscabiei]|uniref:hypothetical protein n=1 Tax=Streptomyces brasiliscabiei TaxID=2736302 RepID=UPI001C0F69D3|nr:hypothetical protein [Streptomyces brasiliscabiei]
MDVADVVALLLVMLAPGVGKLIDSVACRNRARARAVVIRARRELGEPRLQPAGKRGRGRSDD